MERGNIIRPRRCCVYVTGRWKRSKGKTWFEHERNVRQYDNDATTTWHGSNDRLEDTVYINLLHPVEEMYTLHNPHGEHLPCLHSAYGTGLSMTECVQCKFFLKIKKTEKKKYMYICIFCVCVCKPSAVAHRLCPLLVTLGTPT